MSFQSITILGNLGKDPAVSYTQAGMALCKFSVATSEKRKGEEKTTWFDVVVFDKLGELCGQHLAKGRTVLVQGRISVEDWTDKDGARRRSWSLIANTVQFVGGKGDKGAPATEKADAPAAPGGFVDDGDLPF
jgi:single-strand DNA-binding protein